MDAKSSFHAYWPAFLICVGGCCYAIMDVFAKLLVDKHGIPAAPVIFVRMVITAVLASGYMAATGVPDPILGPKEVRYWLLFRGLLGALSLNMFYNSFRFLPLADALSIWFTVPVIVGVLAAVALKEPYTRNEGLCGAVSLVGVVCVVRPTVIFGSSEQAEGNRAFGVTLAVVATFLGAGVFIVVRHIGDRANTLFFVSYFGYLSAIVMAILMIVDPGQRALVAQIHLSDLIYLIGLSLFGFLATYCQNRAVQLVKAGRITLLLYVQLPLVAVLAWLVFGEALSALTGVGCIIIIASAIAIALNKEKDRAEQVSTTEDATQYIELGQEDSVSSEEPRGPTIALVKPAK